MTKNVSKYRKQRWRLNDKYEHNRLQIIIIITIISSVLYHYICYANYFE